MKELYASALLKSNLEGGTTLPCLMEVCDNTGVYQGEWIVKVFKQKNETQLQATSKEFIANQLAIEFDLDVPEAALVFVRKEIIEELIKVYNYHDIKEGWYFATNYIKDIIQYQQSFTSRKIDVESQETIFAFDMLILNRDRKIEKPNCFMHNKSLFLIDHELSLNITIKDDYQAYKKNIEWQGIATGNKNKRKEHIFYKNLRKKRKKNSNFAAFQEYLRTLKLNKVQNVVSRLEDREIEVGDFTGIELYLEEAKKDSLNFCEILKRILS